MWHDSPALARRRNLAIEVLLLLGFVLTSSWLVRG